jgi:4-amino-4-deoxy-L-arabinose transferase-like glycosyltransferase
VRALLAFFGVLHLALLAHDAAHLERFVRADRAEQRMGVIESFVAVLRDGGSLRDFLAGHGVPGDWLPQALLYAAGGPLFVIAVQVALALLSIVWVRDIAARVLPGRAALAAAFIYALLPHSLTLPHQLTSEAIFVPLIILSFRLAFGPASGLALGAAALIRPVVLLWPVVCALRTLGGWGRSAGYLAAALAPVLAWALFMLAATGELTLGKAGHDLGHNLYQRMHRMAAALPEAERPARRPPGETTATLGEYLRFVAQHPAAAVAHGARDVATMSVKSGIERLVMDKFDWFAESRAGLQDPASGWRARVEQRGPFAVAMEILREEPGLIIVSGGTAALFIAFMALAGLGAWDWLRRRASADAGTRRQRWLLLAFVVYVFATAQAVDAAQSRHRAPAEFALTLLAVAGWLRLRQKKKRPSPSRDWALAGNSRVT